MHTFNPSTEAEMDRSLVVLGQPGLHDETLSQRGKKEEGEVRDSPCDALSWVVAAENGLGH